MTATDFHELYTTEPGPSWAKEDRAYTMLTGFLRERGVDTSQYGIDAFFDVMVRKIREEMVADIREEGEGTDNNSDRRALLSTADFLEIWVDQNSA